MTRFRLVATQPRDPYLDAGLPGDLTSIRRAQKRSSDQPGGIPMATSGTPGCSSINAFSRCAQLLPGDSVDSRDWSATRTGYSRARRAGLCAIAVGSASHVTNGDVGSAGDTPRTAFHSRPWWAQMFRTRTKVRIQDTSSGSLIPRDLAIAVRSARRFKLPIRRSTCPKVRRSMTIHEGGSSGVPYVIR